MNERIEVETPERRGPGRPRSAVPEARLHVSMSKGLRDRLEEIQSETGAASVSEVVKDALVLYAAALDVHRKGGYVLFKDKDGQLERVNLFL
jgi:hypothetical protein